MSPFRTALLTGALTLLLGAGIVASWLHFRPLEIPRFARVNIGASSLSSSNRWSSGSSRAWTPRNRPGSSRTPKPSGCGSMLRSTRSRRSANAR
jgi:hypothetical protein